jgi:hypothetical protein
MLLRGSQDQTGFTVPVVKRRSIEKADPSRDKLERITGEAVAKREATDARVSATFETARSRAQLLEMLSEAEQNGDVGEGFAVRFARDLKKAKDERLSRAANPEALGLLKDGAEDLDRDLHHRALRAEAGARTRERIVRIGRMIDDLVAAAQAAPRSFEIHHATAREAISGLNLPSKVVAAFRARLPEIPRAALRALAQKEPDVALDLIKRRKGPAHPKFGVEPSVAQMIAKQARAKLDEDDGTQAIDEGVNALRALADREEAVAAYGRGEAGAEALSLRGLDGVGAPHLRRLRQDGHAVRQRRRGQERASANVRKRFAQGLKLDADDDAQVEGLDLVYARDATSTSGEASDVGFAAAAGMLPKGLIKKIGDLVLSDDDERVAAGAKLVQAIEGIDAALTKRLDPHILDEAHEIIDIVEAGIDWIEAARLARERVDVSASERERRAQQFAQQFDPEWVTRTLEDALELKPVQGVDAPDMDASQP